MLSHEEKIEKYMKELAAIAIPLNFTNHDNVEETHGEENPKEEKKDYVQWQKVGERKFLPVGEIEIFDCIPPGIYDIKYDSKLGVFLEAKKISLDELFVLPSPEQGHILKDIKTFWERKEMFKKYEFTYKRGILLYGPAGTGKSSIINLLAKELVETQKGVVLYLNSARDLELFIDIMPKIREIEKDKQVLCVLEDLESFTGYKDVEIQLLNVLDGMNQTDNIVYLATTNYPEHLKERILNRPSRFDRRYEISFPNDEVRETYFKNKLKESDLETIDLEKWVKETEGLTLAHLGEIVKSVCALGNTFEETLELLNDMKKKLSSYDFNKDSTTSIGFGSSSKKIRVK